MRMAKFKGINGGYVNILRLGIMYDTRDFEPDLKSRYFAELTMKDPLKHWVLILNLIEHLDPFAFL